MTSTIDPQQQFANAKTYSKTDLQTRPKTTYQLKDLNMSEVNVPATVPEAANLPAFLQGRETKPIGLDDLDRVIRPSYLKIVQAMSRELKGKGFSEGDMVMMPAEIVLPEEITVIPILQYSLYQCVNPIQAKTLPMIREQSLDPDSPIAEKCRNFESFACPEAPEHKCIYQHVLVYLVWLEEVGDIVSITFRGAEFKTGSAWGSKIRIRRQDIYAGRYTIRTEEHQKNDDAWEGLNIRNAEQPWVEDEELFNALAEKHKLLDKQKGQIQVTESGESEEDDGDASEETSF